MQPENIKRIGIMGGTFDPIHLGHLLAAERAKEVLELDKVIFIPAGTPPHKNYSEMADATTRYKMVKMAIRKNPFFEISDIELKREGYSYTIDTVEQINQQFGEACKLYFIIGTDNVSEILSWKKAEKLIRMIDFIIVTRPGALGEESQQDVSALVENNCKFSIIEMPLIHIESNNIRQRVMDGLSIKYMVPEEIEEYIVSNNLYNKYSGREYR